MRQTITEDRRLDADGVRRGPHGATAEGASTP